MGVNKGASNIAVLSELGLFPLALSSIKASIGYWDHLVTLNENTLAKRAYRDNMILKDSLCNTFKLLFEKIGFSHVWNNQGTLSKNRLLYAVNKKLEDNYIQYWKNNLFDDSSNPNGNKLRLFRKVKSKYGFENYLFSNHDKNMISVFTKLRISNSNLNIERGRYNKTPLNQRLCPLCKTGVEDECHFILKCEKLNEPRNRFFDKLTEVVPSFNNFKDHEKVLFVLGDNDTDILEICISGIFHMYSLNASLKATL